MINDCQRYLVKLYLQSVTQNRSADFFEIFVRLSLKATVKIVEVLCLAELKVTISKDFSYFVYLVVAYCFSIADCSLKCQLMSYMWAHVKII